MFKCKTDQQDFESYLQLLNKYATHLPKEIATEIAFASTGRCVECACLDCSNVMCVLFGDLINFKKGKKNDKWVTDPKTNVFFCKPCAKIGPIIRFRCCDRPKCFHKQSKLECYFHQKTQLFYCRDPTTDAKYLGFACCNAHVIYGKLAMCCNQYFCGFHCNYMYCKGEPRHAVCCSMQVFCNECGIIICLECDMLEKPIICFLCQKMICAQCKKKSAKCSKCAVHLGGD